jgi:nitroimidazol reductase NimA-like FMN-containing flavoprotein (pyridoxamine 5'-phosphate oxidase superfamily)
MNFTRKEIAVVGSKDICRISTLSQNSWPHTVPVGYVFLDGTFYVPASPKSRKIRNLRMNSKATPVIDDETTECGVMIECTSTILEGIDAKPMKEYMTKAKGWQNDDTTLVIKLEPLRKSSWFLK